MKKHLAIILACILSLSLFACGDKTEQSDTEDNSTAKVDASSSTSKAQTTTTAQKTTTTKSTTTTAMPEQQTGPTVTDITDLTSVTPPTMTTKTATSIPTYTATPIPTVLAEGGGYQLLAIETENYNGITIEIGVKKNGSWLLEMTSEMPLIDEDGTIYGTSITTFCDEDILILYIGNGCFLCESYHRYYFSGYTETIIYNAETGQIYEKEFDNLDDHICITYNCLGNILFTGRCPNYNETVIIDNNNSYVITESFHYRDFSEIEILDTNTMTSSIVTLNKNVSYVFPVSEGIFAVANSNEEVFFFDTKGNQIFDNYFLLKTVSQSVNFQNGQCTFDILNNNGTPYSITIDLNGNVINSAAIE